MATSSDKYTIAIGGGEWPDAVGIYAYDGDVNGIPSYKHSTNTYYLYWKDAGAGGRGWCIATTKDNSGAAVGYAQAFNDTPALIEPEEVATYAPANQPLTHGATVIKVVKDNFYPRVIWM